MAVSGAPRLLAISDLHVSHPANRRLAQALAPASQEDWLIVAGDVADVAADAVGVLEQLAARFAKVVWAPGNHELWTPGNDPVQLRGEARYRYLVTALRRAGVVTPEDDYPVWTGPGGPVVVAPLFVLYDYTFRTPAAADKKTALAQAYRRGIVCGDEFLLHPDPYPSREAWCAARVAHTEARMAALDPALPTVLVNHYPLVREPTARLRHPEFAQWCGTQATADWHVRFRAAAMVYGHLHIPRTSFHQGVPFVEVSVGYPREWQRPGHPREATAPRVVLPAARPLLAR